MRRRSCQKYIRKNDEGASLEMELLELFAKAIAPQLLNRVFDNIPQSAILFAVIMFFVIKYLLKWNKARVEKLNAKEARSNAILEEVKVNVLQGKEILVKVDKLEVEHKQDRENFTRQFKEAENKVNDVIHRVVRIEARDELKSKQENAVITKIERFINSIEKK
jgi:hypothetical protein